MSSSSLQEKLNTLLNELDEEALENITPEDLLELRKEVNPYGRTIQGSDKLLTFSITNLEERFSYQLWMTGMIGYLNRMLDEYHLPSGIPYLSVYDYAKNPEKLYEYRNKLGDNIAPEVEESLQEFEKWMPVKLYIKEFLESLFQFNPDEHVRSSYKPQPKDTEREILHTPAANLAISRLKKKDANFREHMLEHERTLNLMNMSKSVSDKPYVVDGLNSLVSESELDLNTTSLTEEDKRLVLESEGKDLDLPSLVYNFIPPRDTFHRFKYYLDSNYDILREATVNLYCDKPDFEFAINPYDWHDSQEEAEEFMKKHRDEVITDIYTAHSGKWNMLASFKENRNAVKYFNKDTIVLEEIMNQNEKDAKLGAELMKKRIKKKKQRNMEQEGPDDEAFVKWKEQNNKLASKGAISLNKEAYVDDECDDDEIQIDVFRVSGKTGDMDKNRIFVEAEAPVMDVEDEKH